MKVTKSQLKQIIKEEISRVLREGAPHEEITKSQLKQIIKEELIKVLKEAAIPREMDSGYIKKLERNLKAGGYKTRQDTPLIDLLARYALLVKDPPGRTPGDQAQSRRAAIVKAAQEITASLRGKRIADTETRAAADFLDLLNFTLSNKDAFSAMVTGTPTSTGLPISTGPAPGTPVADPNLVVGRGAPSSFSTSQFPGMDRWLNPEDASDETVDLPPEEEEEEDDAALAAALRTWNPTTSGKEKTPAKKKRQYAPRPFQESKKG